MDHQNKYCGSTKHSPASDILKSKETEEKEWRQATDTH